MDTLANASRKVQLRLIWPLVLLMFLSSLDRVNVSFGALQMNRELGLSPSTYGLGVGLFFVGYILFQIPSTWLLRRYGARRWLFWVVLSWGLAATAMAFIQNAPQFFILRVLLGFAESGFAPGIVWLCSQWIPARFRASAIAATMLAIPISIVFGGPLSGWLMDMANPVGWPGWRWMFLLEGLPTVILAFVAWVWFVDHPNDAKWLSADEKRALAEAVAAEPVPERAPGNWGELLVEPRIWIAAATWYATLAGAYGLIFWLPTVVQQVVGGSALQASTISALPWVAVGTGMMLNAWHSDRTQERYVHSAGGAVIGAVGLFLAGLIAEPAVALVCLVIGGFGLGACQSVFWTVPPTLLSRTTQGPGITLINMIGNSAGIVGPWAIGLIRESTDAFAAPIYAMSALLALAAVLAMTLRAMQRPVAAPS